MFNKEDLKRRNCEFYAMATVQALEIARAFGKFMVPMPEFLAEHSGDFAGGYLANWFLNTQTDNIPFFRRIPEKRRLMINAGISMAIVTAVETYHIFGEPQLEDIPAGVVGIATSIGVRRLSQRWVNRQIKSI